MTNPSAKLRRWFSGPIYPFFFAVFLVLRYIRYHILDASISAVVVTLLVALLCVLGIRIVLTPIRDQDIRSFFVWCLTLAILSYANLRNTIVDWSVIEWVHQYFILPVGALLIVAALILVLRKFPKAFASITSILTVAGLFLIATSGFDALKASTSLKKSRSAVHHSLPQLTASTDTPDIYFFIFDRYTGSASLKSLYGYDNSGFLDKLRERGFYVADKSSANYFGTFHSVPATLNFNYHHELVKDVPKSIGGEALLDTFLKDNATVLALKEAGYDYYHVGSWWDHTRTNWQAESSVAFTPTRLPLPAMASYFLTDVTLLRPLVNRFGGLRAQKIVESEIAAIDRLSKQGGQPKIVFSHFLLPHNPNIYDKDCRGLSLEESKKREGTTAGYLEQVTCTNQFILQMVDSIQKNSQRPPLIVVQSDEGQPLHYLDEPADLRSWPDKELLERFPNLNAIYFPDKNYEALYPTLSSVNTFRIIFNQFFGTNLAILPDKNYMLPRYYSPYGEVDVTDRVTKLIDESAR